MSGQSIGIIGYGRFGALMHSLLKAQQQDRKIRVYDIDQTDKSVEWSALADVARSDIVIPCVPIKAFEQTLTEIAPLLAPESLVLDVCSIKLHPVSCMLTILPEHIACVSSHPMFGPATYQKRQSSSPGSSLKGLSVVLHNVRAPQARYEQIRTFLESLDLTIVEMNPDAHDRIAARFQFICLTAATVLKRLDIHRSAIDTESASKMLDFLEMISVDPHLVKDMYEYNPYCKDQLQAFAHAFEEFVMFLEGKSKTV